jgi:subtilisin family serine protease
MRERSKPATVLALVTVLSAAPAAQQPTRPQLEIKTSGLVRALASPGTLADSLPGPKTPVERELATEQVVAARGGVLPALEVFVQYKPGAAAAPPTLHEASTASVAKLAANDAVRAIELHRPPSFQLEDVQPFNRDARRTHHVEEFAARFPDFTGAGRVAAVVDAGAVLDTHQEFAGTDGTRVRVQTTSKPDRHATHVAGTIIAAGVDQRAKGMAPSGSVISIDFGSDLEKMAGLPADAVQVTNHSYGPTTGWHFDQDYGWLWWGDRRLSETEDARFGRYTARESALDELLAHPGRARWLAFVAAGNDRNDGPEIQPVKHYVYNVVGNRLEWEVSEQPRALDGDDRGGVDTISGFCVAKNVVCVGAIHDARAGVSPSTTAFSAWGPADDGRIKPDLTANGQNLLSASNASNAAYLEMPGTSMASPTAAGIGLIVGQAFSKHRGREPLGSDLKAVLIHSAVDAGRRGPDVEFGWGVIDALAAGELVADTRKHLIDTFDVAEGPGATRSLEANGQPIRVSLVWSDIPGEANQGGLDDSTPALQNDLDLELIDPAGAVHHPYRLDRNNPLAVARRDGVNRVDNVEVVDAQTSRGTWQIRVRAHAIKAGSAQRATLVVSGLQ